MERKIIIEAEGFYQEDYQMRMLTQHHIQGLLKVRGRGVDMASYYEYEVSGKVSMKAMYERGKLSSEDLKLFLNQLICTIKETEKFLLDINNILLDPEYIFYENGKFYFCFYPPGGEGIWDVFRKLTEYFVQHADYSDRLCVEMVFILHKGAAQENYSLEKLNTECMQAEEESYEQWKDNKEQERKKESLEYDTLQHDWIAEQEMAGAIMEETENMWTPVKKFLNRHKRSRWGDWDGLYIEEEDL